MSTLFLELNAVQSPFDMRAVDGQNRVMLSVNFLCSINATAVTLEECIIKLIVDAGLATLGSDLFVGSNYKIPNLNEPFGAGPLTTILRTGGLSPNQTHNNDFIQHPGIQVITRATNYTAARNKIETIYNLLNGKHNITVAA
jgi:minor capsid protein